MSVIVAYVPVIHSGYLQFFRDHLDSAVYLIDPRILDTLGGISYIARDMRACPVEEVARMLRATLDHGRVFILSESNLAYLKDSDESLIMPDEDVSRKVAEIYFQDRQVSFSDVFLRWNWENVKKEVLVKPDQEITQSEFLIGVMANANNAALRSSDWWRQVGAVLFRDTEVLASSHNKHFPSEHTPYIVGDPRTVFGPGESIEISSAHHAEKRIIAWAARRGISTEGTSIAVTTFPCPGCAMDIVEAGIKVVYYSEGYSLVDAEGILRSGGVSIIKVINPE